MERKLSVVAGIPAFDEERTIAKVVARAKKYVDRVIVVDDGSQDDTGLIAESMGAVVVRHDKNLGKGAAIRDCFRYAKQSGADVLVTIDADGQHDAARIPLLVDTLETTDADVVIGSRVRRPPGMPRYRWFGQRVLDAATQVTVGERIADAQSGFRAYSRKAIESLQAAEFGMGVDSEVLMRAHRARMKIVEVPVTIGYGGLKTSTHNPVAHSLDVLFSLVKFISIRHPLTFYGGFAIISLAISLIFGVMTIDYYNHYGSVVTNLALISVACGILGFLALFTGFILFTLITVVREHS